MEAKPRWGDRGADPIVRRWTARPSSQDEIGIRTVMRSCSASQASSYQEIAATARSSARSSAARAGALTRSGSADHQCTTCVSSRTASMPTRRSRTPRWRRGPPPRPRRSSPSLERPLERAGARGGNKAGDGTAMPRDLDLLAGGNGVEKAQNGRLGVSGGHLFDHLASITAISWEYFETIGSRQWRRGHRRTLITRIGRCHTSSTFLGFVHRQAIAHLSAFSA